MSQRRAQSVSHLPRTHSESVPPATRPTWEKFFEGAKAYKKIQDKKKRCRLWCCGGTSCTVVHTPIYWLTHARTHIHVHSLIHSHSKKFDSALTDGLEALGIELDR